MRHVLGFCAIAAVAVTAAAGPVAQAGPLAKKPRLSIPLPKSGDFTVAIVTAKVKAKPGKTIPAGLKLRLKLVNKALASQVTVAGSVRKNNRSTFDIVVAVVNKRSGNTAARQASGASAPTINVDVISTSQNVDLQLVERLPGARSYLDNILTRPPAQQASWDPVWKGAERDVEAGVNVYLDKGLAEEGIPEEYLLLILAVALEISEDGEPDKGQALDILGEVNELYVQIGDFGCEVTVQRNRFVSSVVDIFIKKCQEPIVEVAVVLPEMVPGLGYGRVVMFTPQGQIAGELTAGCKPLDNAVYGIECPVTGFKLSYDIATALVNVPAGTPLAVAICQSSDDIAVFSQRVPA